jgi:hypothetical protein
MGEAATLLGLGGVTFDFGGRRLPVGERTLDVEALFENYLEGRALDAVRRHRGRSDEEYKLQLAAWQEACAAGAYAWGEPACERALAYLGSPGWRELAYLQLKAADPGAPSDLLRDLIDEACKDPAATRELAEAMRRVSDPLARNGRGPGPSPPSAPSSSAAATAATAPAGSAG